MSPKTSLAALEAVGVELHAAPETWTALAADVLEGLSTTPKTLPPKWFYDARGSELFDAICEQPEYYPTRREAALLRTLDPLHARGTLRRYVPVDVSASAMEAAIPGLAARYPGVEITAHVSDFTAGLVPLRERTTDGPRVVAFLGSTIGNLQPPDVHAFFGAVRELLAPGDVLLLGHDLVKSPSIVEPAYDDAAGVTADFNRNVLRVINRELQADFDEDLFAHEATWNPMLERIEIRLRATEPQVVRIASLGLEVTFLEGESILTEISRKFRPEVIERSAVRAGLALRAWYEDADGWYGVSLLERG
ncbi:MAG: L-histidine N(alpha)-methyltransferase [Solirubrobacteraceae bacterium]